MGATMRGKLSEVARKLRDNGHKVETGTTNGNHLFLTVNGHRIVTSGSPRNLERTLHKLDSKIRRALEKPPA